MLKHWSQVSRLSNGSASETTKSICNLPFARLRTSISKEGMCSYCFHATFWLIVSRSQSSQAKANDFARAMIYYEEESTILRDMNGKHIFAFFRYKTLM